MSLEAQKSNTVAIVVAVLGVIGTVVASIIGASATINAEKLRQESALTQIALVAIATQGGATQVSMASTISAPVNAPTDILITPTVGNSNPVGIIQANVPITVDGLVLSFREIKIDHNNTIYIVFSVKNIGDRSRIFRFTGFSLTLRDDIGNIYPSYIEPDCNPTILYNTDQVNIDKGQEKRITSYPDYWCMGEFNGQGSFQRFAGPIAQQAKSLFIGFKDFGPFTGFEIEVKP